MKKRGASPGDGRVLTALALTRRGQLQALTAVA